MKRLASLFVIVVVLASSAMADTIVMVDKTCPLCEEKFTARLDGSGTQLGMRLDLKPLGHISAPWRVAVCPKCKYVFFKDKLSEEETAKCKKIVASEEYKKHTGRSSHFLLGLLYEGLQEDASEIAYVFLQASWQEEESEKLLEEDLRRSLKYFDMYLKQGLPKGVSKSESYHVFQMVKGEILRRLGRFDEAMKLFQSLGKDDFFKKEIVKVIVARQAELIDAKDTDPHPIPRK